MQLVYIQNTEHDIETFKTQETQQKSYTAINQAYSNLRIDYG